MVASNGRRARANDGEGIELLSWPEPMLATRFAIRMMFFVRWVGYLKRPKR